MVWYDIYDMIWDDMIWYDVWYDIIYMICDMIWYDFIFLRRIRLGSGWVYTNGKFYNILSFFLLWFDNFEDKQLPEQMTTNC